MGKSKISTEVKEEIEEIIDQYNANAVGDYFVEYRGDKIYLKRLEVTGHISPVARLHYTGSLDDLDFAVYRWTTEKYDPEESFFPGSELFDGTILGAMKTGEKSCPPIQNQQVQTNVRLNKE